MNIHIEPYCGLNGHRSPPPGVVCAALAQAGENLRRKVKVRPYCNGGEYTIEPLDGWMIQVSRAGARTRTRYYSPSGEFIEEITCLYVA